jgi:hypothetical protein
LAEHLAIVNWLRKNEDGGLVLPHSLQYVGLSRFPSDSHRWPEGAYRVVCSFAEPPSEHGSPMEAKVQFLAEGGPEERLVAGTRFGLYEGLQEVASVEVLW